jgi:hypothetical protein
VPFDGSETVVATPSRGVPQADPVSRAGQGGQEGGRDAGHETPLRPGHSSSPPR